MNIPESPENTYGNELPEGADAEARDDRGKAPKSAVAEAAAMLGVFIFLAREAGEGWPAELQLSAVGWNYLPYLIMIVLALVSTLAAGGGLSGTVKSLDDKRSASGMKGINIMVMVVVAVWAVGALVPALSEGLRPSFMVPPVYFAKADDWPGPISNLVGYGLTLAFGLVYGFGIELFYRGAIQSSINRAMGRPYSIKGIRFGAGLFIASALYVIGQGLFIYSPMVSEPSTVGFDLSTILPVAAEGLVFGAVYEKAGNVLVPALLHSAVGYLFFCIEFVPY